MELTEIIYKAYAVGLSVKYDNNRLIVLENTPNFNYRYITNFSTSDLEGLAKFVNNTIKNKEEK